MARLLDSLLQRLPALPGVLHNSFVITSIMKVPGTLHIPSSTIKMSNHASQHKNLKLHILQPCETQAPSEIRSPASSAPSSPPGGSSQHRFRV